MIIELFLSFCFGDIQINPTKCYPKEINMKLFPRKARLQTDFVESDHLPSYQSIAVETQDFTQEFPLGPDRMIVRGVCSIFEGIYFFVYAHPSVDIDFAGISLVGILPLKNCEIENLSEQQKAEVNSIGKGGACVLKLANHLDSCWVYSK